MRLDEKVVLCWIPGTRGWPNSRGAFRQVNRDPAGVNAPVGFTLVELLVVVAIIGLLAGLLLSALGRAQAQGYGTVCLSNLRQLQIAWQAYTEDHGSQFPDNRSELSSGIWRSTPSSWTGPSSAPFDTDTLAIEQGSLIRGAYIPTAQVYRCPSDDSVVQGGQGHLTDLGRSRSYALNGNFGGREQESQLVHRREQASFNSSAVFVFVDEDALSIDDGHFLVWRNPDNRWVNMPTDRHRRGSTLSFADGHAELWRWEWQKRFEPKVEYWKPAVNDADLRDLRRMQKSLVDSQTHRE